MGIDIAMNIFGLSRLRLGYMKFYADFIIKKFPAVFGNLKGALNRQADDIIFWYYKFSLIPEE